MTILISFSRNAKVKLILVKFCFALSVKNPYSNFILKDNIYVHNIYKLVVDCVSQSSVKQNEIFWFHFIHISMLNQYFASVILDRVSPFFQSKATWPDMTGPNLTWFVCIMDALQITWPLLIFSRQQRMCLLKTVSVKMRLVPW